MVLMNVNANSSCQAGAVESLMIIFGGMLGSDEAIFNDTWIISFALDNLLKPTAILINGTSPPARYGHSAVVLGMTMFIFGGVSGYDSFVSDRINGASCIWRLTVVDANTASWYCLPTLGVGPRPRMFHFMVTYNTDFCSGSTQLCLLVAFGWIDNISLPLNDTFILSKLVAESTSATWVNLSATIQPLAANDASTLGTRLESL